MFILRTSVSVNTARNLDLISNLTECQVGSSFSLLYEILQRNIHSWIIWYYSQLCIVLILRIDSEVYLDILRMHRS